MKRALRSIALLLIAVPLCAALGPASFSGLSFRQHPGAQLPLSADFVDESGRRVTLQQALGGRPALVVLDYLRCSSLCSLVLSGAVTSLARAGLIPGRDLSLVAISIDPSDKPADSAAAKQRYARLFPAAASGGIHFLTSATGETSKVASVVGFPYRYDQASHQFAHPAGFVITTGTGRISRYVLGLYPPAATVKQALATAGQGKVEPPAHPLLLLCFGYDPDAGTAAALVMRLVRMVSLIILASCALLIVFLSSRRRRTQ